MGRYRGVRIVGGGIQIRYQVGRRRFSQWINATPTEQALSDAARLRKRLIEQARIGEEDGPTERMRFEEACRRALASIGKRRKPSTVQSYAKRLAAHWSGLAHLDVRMVTRTAIIRADHAQDWKSQKTRKDCLSALSCVLQWATDQRYISANPMRGYETIRHQRPDVEVFTDDELSGISRHLKGTPKVLYALMLQTGCRTGELQALQWSDVEPDALKISGTIWKGKKSATTKNARIRRVMLTVEAKRILKAHTASRFSGGFVFKTQQGNPYDEKDLTRAFRKACEAAGVAYRRPYTLRHTYASRALSRGVEVAWLAEQMGDNVLTVMRHYARWIGGERDQRELAKLEAV